MPKNIRYTTINRPLEAELKAQDNALMRQWLSEAIGDLEYRIRYADLEETKHIQGALRVLYDISEIILG